MGPVGLLATRGGLTEKNEVFSRGHVVEEVLITNLTWSMANMAQPTEEEVSGQYPDGAHEIPFYVHGAQKWVSGITYDTTCSNVLDSLIVAASGKSGDGSNRLRGCYVLVEQWRGVERQLSLSSHILKLWLAWGDERQHVKFVVKKIRRDIQEKSDSWSSNCHRRRRRGCQGCNFTSSNTVHPKKVAAAVAKLSTKDTKRLSQGQLMDMMKELMVQGRYICQEITKLEASTSKKSPSQQQSLSTSKGEHDESTGEDEAIEAELEKTRSLASQLVRLVALNEELHRVETRQHLLDSNVQSLLMAMPNSNKRGKEDTEATNKYEEEAAKIMSEVSALRSGNKLSTEVIAHNDEALRTLQTRLNAAQDMVKKLEYDVNVVEKEGRKLNNQLGRVRQLDIPEGSTLLDDDQVVHRPTEDIYNELKALQREIAAKEESIQIVTVPPSMSSEDMMTLFDSQTVTTAQTMANVSLEGCSFSSGASSGAESSYQAPELILGKKRSSITKMSNGTNVAAAAAATTAAAAADIDTNSDTGLSSLHSSGEEEAAVVINAYDRGTLV